MRHTTGSATPLAAPHCFEALTDSARLRLHVVASLHIARRQQRGIVLYCIVLYCIVLYCAAITFRIHAATYLSDNFQSCQIAKIIAGPDHIDGVGELWSRRLAAHAPTLRAVCWQRSAPPGWRHARPPAAGQWRRGELAARGAPLLPRSHQCVFTVVCHRPFKRFPHNRFT